MLNLTDNSSFDETVFNGSVGKIVYELPPSEAEDNVFLKGDNRAIVNQSSATLAQVYISQGATRYEMAITYRPSAGSTVTYSSDGRPVNDLRIYIISLNSSESITRNGESASQGNLRRCYFHLAKLRFLPADFFTLDKSGCRRNSRKCFSSNFKRCTRSCGQLRNGVLYYQNRRGRLIHALNRR